jgi:predicted aminopeptidase
MGAIVSACDGRIKTATVCRSTCGFRGIIRLVNSNFLRLMALVLGSSALALSLSSCWYTRQAAYFLSERARAQPIGRVAGDPDLPSSVRGLLSTVERVRKFATETLGLAPGKNYTRYLAVDKDYVADVVSACAPDSFTRHYWHYPLVGDLPYRGFYRKDEAIGEAARLKATGLDVIVREVEAFSSLGYFADPLYSFMASYDEDAIAELVIHESAHATLFIKGADQFNEEFATFIGRKGAELYLAGRYGKDSPELAKRRERQAESAAFVAFLSETARLLEIVYDDDSIKRGEKLRRKADIIASRASAYKDAVAKTVTADGYRGFDMGTVNNAYLDLYRLYEEDLDLYESWLGMKAGGSIPSFVASLVDLSRTAGSGIKAAMAQRL